MEDTETQRGAHRKEGKMKKKEGKDGTKRDKNLCVKLVLNSSPSLVSRLVREPMNFVVGDHVFSTVRNEHQHSFHVSPAC